MEPKAQAKKTVVFIDQQKFELEAGGEHTVRDLIVLAGEDPAETTLVLRDGDELVKLNDQSQVVDLKNGMHFVIYHNTPTPVS